MERDEVMNLYRELREISSRHHDAAMGFLSRQRILDQARRLGLLFDRSFIAESDEEMTLVFDLALYTSQKGRSRPLDRYSRAGHLPPGSREARMLDAMRQARFSLWQIERPHEVAGCVVWDVLRDEEAWLVDGGLEVSAPEGMVFAARLAAPEEFAMTSGVIVPVDPLLITEVAADNAAWRNDDPSLVAEDWRFATAIYRAAIASGAMASVHFD